MSSSGKEGWEAKRVSRRNFLKASGLALGAAALPSLAAEVPKLDGSLVWDDATCAAAASDYGNFIHRLPRAVLRPGSVLDVVRIVRYANRHGLKIAFRGQGHSTLGQSQVKSGIVIDSSTMAQIQLRSNRLADAQPGVLWRNLVSTALQVGLTPPVLPDSLYLTVGGTISTGGIGESSYRLGAQVDYVKEVVVEVVTGAGDHLVCSTEHNRELFEMCLSGFGQCAFIVRVRLRLSPAPKEIAIETAPFSKLDSYLDEMERLGREQQLDLLSSRIQWADNGAWTFQVSKGVFSDGPGKRVPYWEHVSRQAQPTATSNLRPMLGMALPYTETLKFMAGIMANPPLLTGGRSIIGLPLNTPHFHMPLFRLPDSPLAFWFRIVREAPVKDGPAMLAANREILSRLPAVGGFAFLPYAKFEKQEEWARHYGLAWGRFVSAKRQYDPNGILTPGLGIFAAPAR